MVPSIRSRRAVSNGGLLLPVAYDLTCFIRFFSFQKKCLKSAESEIVVLNSEVGDLKVR